MRRAWPLLNRPHRAWVVALTIGAGLAAGSARAEALRPLPTFGAGVEIVNLNLAITDVRHRHLKDLDASELTLFEDGVRQEISLFARETVPLSLTILIDGSSSMRPRLPATRVAALRLIHSLAPGDEAQVAQFDRRLRVLQEPTSDRAALEQAVAAIEANGDTALHDALYVALKELRARPDDELRRRALVLLSDGQDTASLVSDDQVLELARRTEQCIYSIGLRAPADGETIAPTDYFLTALARESGGQAFFPRAAGDLEGVFERIADELRTLYAVGYVSANPAVDGGWRRVAIQTARQNVLVRHRPGYFAPTPRPASAIRVPPR